MTVFIPLPGGLWLLDIYVTPEKAAMIRRHGDRLALVCGPTSLELCQGLDMNLLPPCSFLANLTADGTGLQVILHPPNPTNPNLDGLDYHLRVGEVSLARKRGRRSVAPDDPDKVLDLDADPKLRDFVRCFRRDRADMMFPVAEGDKTAICLAIGNTGSDSMADSLHNSGLQPMPYFHYQPHQVIARMHGFMVPHAAESHPPPLAYVHHWAPLSTLFSNARYFTLLRDPVRRMLSSYWYWKDNDANAPSLEKWVDDISEGGWGNSQLNWVINATDPEYAPSIEDRRRLVRTPNGPRFDTAAIGQAFRSCEEAFFLVGITEYFDHSLFLIHLLLGLNKVGKWRHLLRSSASRGAHCPQSTRTKLEEICSLETEFYQAMRRSFETEFADEIAFFDRHVGTLQIPEAAS